MKIDDKTVDQVAFLAKLNFKGEEKEKIKTDLDNILALCEKLGEVDTENTDPLIFLSPEINRMAEDQSSFPVDKQQALKNAPVKDSDYFKVPRFKK